MISSACAVISQPRNTCSVFSLEFGEAHVFLCFGGASAPDGFGDRIIGYDDDAEYDGCHALRCGSSRGLSGLWGECGDS